MNIDLIIDSHIRIPTAKLSDEIIRLIEDAATILNQERLKAAKRGIAVGDMPKTIEFYHHENDHLVVSRGYANLIDNGLREFGYTVEWHSDMTEDERVVQNGGIEVYPYQESLIERVIDSEQGIAVAPTGAGKTVAVLELIRTLGGNALVIVNTKEILQQWLDRVNQWLGESYPVGLVGDGVMQISDGITIAIQASLWSKRDELRENGFFQRFQIVCLDECHHATANTYRYVINEFHSRWRFGMSATPDKTGDFDLAQAVLGDVIVEISDADVGDKTIKPSVEVIETGFYFKYKSWVTPWGLKQNNYASLLKHLSEDGERNRLIAQEIVHNHRENANLVLSKRLKHLKEIEAELARQAFPLDDIYWLTGKQTREERKKVVELIEKGSCVVLSTLADEALDAPRLDRLHLCFPTANPKLLLQQIGRIRRRHPDKKDAKIIDYFDSEVGPFNKNYMTRRHEVYDPKGFQVIKRKDK